MPHLNPHALRHAYASVLIAFGQLSDLELARALGHSSAQITREIYGHLLTDPASKTANICFLQAHFGKSCNIKMDNLACPKWTMLQLDTPAYNHARVIPLQTGFYYSR